MFVDVILPLSLSKLYTYSVPDEIKSSLLIGKRVVVQFGKKKIYTALVKSIHEKTPLYQTKEILSVLDEQPVVNERQLEFWDWISSYYLCTLGEVMIAALPSGLKLESETRIRLVSDETIEKNIVLHSKEDQLLEALKLKDGLSLEEISSILKRKNVFPAVQSLIAKGLITIDEELVRKFKSKTESFVRLTEKGTDDDWMKTLFDKLEKKAPKQLELLMTFMKYSMDEKEEEIVRSRLLDISGTTSSVLEQLVKKGVFEIIERETTYIKPITEEPATAIEFSDFQRKAIGEIEEGLNEKEVVLLHGVTSCGKTEIYIRYIEEYISKGKQVLYLLPEIALTSQMIRRLQKHFGNKVGVYHSRFSDNQRVEVWNHVLSNPAVHSGIKGAKAKPGADHFQVILGARSALFLPFSNLGLVIVDEEHENSFKQQDPAPRYHARDSAIFLAKMHGAKTILGSATPSVESYFNARNGKYALVEVNERFGGIHMPEITIADVREETRKKLMKSHFSTELMEGIKSALDKKEQVILFQNRRGYAPYLECPTCGWSPHCVNCDVTLVYHKHSNNIRCHYCGYHQEPPAKCGACGEPALKMLGFGTEKIEDELSIFFPDARISRLDMDTAHSRHSFNQIIYDFEKQKTDILVGTQMVTKGLDFDHVSTVGILNADGMLKHPNFRSHERGYQLMAQVGGRSGRKNKRGRVIIQAFNPKHPIISYVVLNDYKSFYSSELEERQKFHYPPFSRLTEITLKHRDIRHLSTSAGQFAEALRKAIGNKEVLGPELPVVGRIRNLYLNNILIKTDKSLAITEVKKRILKVLEEFRAKEENRSVIVQIDVDPQ